MSVKPPAISRSSYAEPRPNETVAPAVEGRPRARLVVVALVLVVSGLTRSWQERRVERVMDRGRALPFRLDDLPMVLGPWEGRETSIDPRIARIAGADDLITRHYVDRRTGVGLDVLVLYGPSFGISMHSPEICYPAAGFEALPGRFDRPIMVVGRAPASFRSMAFVRGEGGLADSQEVYCGLRSDGHWASQPPSPRDATRVPGTLKVQVSRRLSGIEKRDVENPCEPFLAAMVGEIETRLEGGRPSSTPR